MTEGQAIFEAIKKDDLRTFGSIIQKKKSNLSLALGRFPLLSLCYLYKSRKIVSAFSESLNAITSYNIIDEEQEIYDRFKRFAKTSLRLYVFPEDKIVSPLEMLAILQDTLYLKRVYKNQPKTEKTQENLTSILAKNGSGRIDFESGRVFALSPFNRLQKTILPLIMVLALLGCIMAVVFASIFKSAFGLGTEESPYKINSIESLRLAFLEDDESKYYELASDLTLPVDWKADEFLASLNGNGYTISIANTASIEDTGFVGVNLGVIKNLSFLIEDFNIEVKAPLGIIAKKNEGTFENVGVSVVGELSENTDEDLDVSCFVYENTGILENCSMFVDLSFIGGGGGNLTVSSIASLNSGRILNAKTLSGSKIVADSCDIGGLVAQNLDSGTIQSSENNAQLSQGSLREDWMPNVGGLVLTNSGTIKNSTNYGNISIQSESDSSRLEMFAGGIACTNLGVLERNKNQADLTGFSKNYNIYLGGITALNDSYYAEVLNCASYGKITLGCENANLYLFAGGVAGYNYGAIKDSFSLMEYVRHSGFTAFGGVAGLGAYETFNQTPVTQNLNNFFLAREEIEFGIAYCLINGSLYLGWNENTTAAESELELRNAEVFWE